MCGFVHYKRNSTRDSPANNTPTITSTLPLLCQKVQTMTVVTYVYLMIASGKVLAAS